MITSSQSGTEPANKKENTMLTKVLYQTEATATGGRDGHARTKDGSLHVWLGLPRELGGVGAGNNPERIPRYRTAPR